MQLNCIRFFLLGALLSTLGLGLAAAQTKPAPPPTPEPSTGGSIRGRVILPSGGFLSESVRITLQTTRGVESSVFTDEQGRFEFTRLSAGNYEVVVEPDSRKWQVSSEKVEVVRGFNSIVNISLIEKVATAEVKNPAKSVSVTELSQIPEKARKEFERASEADKEGRPTDAISHLRSAIAIYPDFMMAHNDLGTQLLALGRLDEAAAELQKAITLDQQAFNPHLNLGIVLVEQKSFSKAAEILSKAVSLNSASASAKLYLGLAFIGLNDVDGAEKELVAAFDLGGPSFAIALFHLGQLYSSKGERVRAINSLEAYLKVAPRAVNASEAQKLLSVLR
jgi:tetratricopeptide (TPR) repeat protein